MDISAVVLNKILTTGDLDSWSRIKSIYLDSSYTALYTLIAKHYTKYSTVPTFIDFDISNRTSNISSVLDAIKLVEVPDVSIDVAIDALIDQFTQNQTIAALDIFVDKLTTLDSTEVKESLAGILLMLDEKTVANENINAMDDIMVFQSEEAIAANRVMLGFNNSFDSVLGGVSIGDLLLLGGKRGHGKSVICANVCAFQYEDGNSCVYFSIEMTALETFQRIMSVLANVDHKLLKLNKLVPADVLKVVKVRAGMFIDAEDLVDKFTQDNDRFAFEDALVKTKQLKEDNQIIIIHDRDLTITGVDIHLGKLKAKFGDKLKVCIVDYLNQINIDGGKDIYDWKPQIEISKNLKNQADKHQTVMISPYQIDDSGSARFARGILDAADMALVIEAHDKSTNAVSFTTTKIRGDKEIDITSGMNWDSLRISPVSIEKPAAAKKKTKDSTEDSEEPKPKKTNSNKKDDSSSDVPWN